MIEELIENATLDDLQNGYFLYQNKEGFRFGVDAVLLSGFARIKKGDIVLDAGTGTGVIPILLAAKTEAAHITGLEIQKNQADLARESVKYNKLEQRIDITCGDIKEASNLFGTEHFDAVVSNPPYMTGGGGKHSDNDAKAIARHEVMCTFDDLCRESSKILKTGGRFFIVHRPFRLAELIRTMSKYHLEPKRMQFAYPFVDREPSMVLIEALKGGGEMVKVEKPLIIYNSDGKYTEQILEIYSR